MYFYKLHMLKLFTFSPFDLYKYKQWLSIMPRKDAAVTNRASNALSSPLEMDTWQAVLITILFAMCILFLWFLNALVNN